MPTAAAARFAACLEIVLREEGGFVNNPRDPGGATNMGITRGTLALWRKVPVSTISPAAVKALTRGEAAAIYAANYWQPIRGDELPAGPDLAVMDYGVNSGVGRASKDAQRVAGVSVDGEIGPATVAAIRRCDPADFIRRLSYQRLSFLRSLAIWKTFGTGWSKRVARVEAKALRWVMTPAGLRAEAEKAKTTAAKQVGTAAGGGVVGTGGAADSSGQVAGGDLSFLPWWGWLLLALVIVAPLVIRAIINGQRAQALAAEAKG